MRSALKTLLGRVRSDYPERYVHTAIENAEGNLQEVWKLAVGISERLSKQSDHLNWSVEHYLRTEVLIKKLHLQNPFRPASQAAWFTAITRFTGSTSNANTPTKPYLISASETLLGRLKQLWWKFYDGLLMKKLAEYQQGDPRILSFIRTIENGTLLEQREAREKLSVILHAFDEIARSQTAYNVYMQFGNERNTLAALKNADEQRRVLAELGVSKQWYASSVDLSKQYQNSLLSACANNPLQDGSRMPIEAELRMAITLSLENELYREWAKMNYNEIEQAVKKAEAVREIERQIAEYKRLNDPPTELPDRTLITPDNKENETTYDYFVEHIYDSDRRDANLLLEYDTWLNDTYGKTEWRKKVELVDRVIYEFASSVIKETIMGGVDTVKFAFNLVVDPQQTTQEILDSAAYLVKNPEVLVEAARTVYKNFDEGTPEERAGMLGSVASLLVPGVSITKIGKASQVAGGLQDVSKLIDNMQDVNKVAGSTKSLADLLPFTSVVTPEGFRMIVPKDFPGQGQVHRVEAPEVNLKNIDDFVKGIKNFDDVLDDYAKLYTERINSNKLWSWNEDILGGKNLTIKQKRLIKEHAVSEGIIPEIKVKKVEDMRYGFADFAGAGVVKETVYLPDSFWKWSDREQFKWLDEQIGGYSEGYTWHHTEVPGKMELVPFGIHNITLHNGGRSTGMWADAPR